MIYTRNRIKNTAFLWAVLSLSLFFTACSNNETYSDKKKRERAAITQYIANHHINVISEAQFYAQNCTTDTAKNEYVLFSSSGVYMQIVREGCGAKLKNGETARVLCRFTETNLKTDSVQLSNQYNSFTYLVDKMDVTNTTGTFRASFVKGSSLMYVAYGRSGSTAVPGGWLVPFTFIKVGRPKTATDEIAKVNLIVPHTQGQAVASARVYPCLYNITYERGI